MSANKKVKAVALELWRRFAHETNLTWKEEIHKGEYIEAAKAIISLSESPESSPIPGQITVVSPNLPDGPAWGAIAKFDEARGYYVTLDPMYAHPATNDSAASRLAFVLRMHDDNYRMLDGEPRKAWSDEFLKSETRQALAEFDGAIPPKKSHKVLAEHSGCGTGTQIDQITVRLEPGDKVILLSRTGFDGSEKSDVG